MGYIDKNLLPDEAVIEKAYVHWFVYVTGTLFFFLSFLFFDQETAPVGVIMFSTGIVLIASAFLFRFSTELAVTNKRVIAKTGLISRKTIELNLSKVESLNVDQSILGRIFNYGQITVNGTGGIKTPFKYISKPLNFRRAVNLEIENFENKLKAVA